MQQELQDGHGPRFVLGDLHALLLNAVQVHLHQACSVWLAVTSAIRAH